MSLADEFAAEREADLQEIEAHFNNNNFAVAPTGNFTGTGSGVATPTMLRAGEQLLVGGKLATIRRTLIVRCSCFSAAPQVKQPLTFNSVQYRMADIQTAPDGVHYEIALMNLSEL